MPLTILQIEALKPEKLCRKHDGSGLYLKVTAGGRSKTFEARPNVHGTRSWLTLGAYPALTLKQARALSAVVYSELDKGTGRNAISAALAVTKDPVGLMDALRGGTVAVNAGRPESDAIKRASGRSRAPADPVDNAWLDKLHPKMPFREVAALWYPWKTSTLSNGKHVNQIWTTLDSYAFPNIGDRPVGEIKRPEIISMIRPIWQTKRTTAKRTLGRVREVFANVAAAGLRDDNPAEIDVRAIFSTVTHQTKHHFALEWQEVPALIDYILDHPPALEETRQATLLMCLTAKRTYEIRSSEWMDIDANGRPVFTTPEERMKMKKRHRVPMSEQTATVFENMRLVLPDEKLVFARPENLSGMLSENTMLNYLKGYDKQLTGHGLRASFRTWARVHKYDSLAAEFALAHVQDSLAEAYMRDDLLAERAEMMQAWANHITQGRSLALKLDR